MEVDVKLKIVDSANGFDFEVALGSGGGSPFSLDKELSDLTNLTKRGGVQSKKFKVVLDKSLTVAYDFFSEAQHHNYKDVDADKDAVILINGNESERGKVRIVGYENKNGTEEVSLLFFGNNFDWTELGKNLTMADIVWTNATELYKPNDIKASWLRTNYAGDEVVWPLESRGARIHAYEVATGDFRPAFFFKAILDRFLQNIGYTLSSTFMEATIFRELVITHFGSRFRVPQETIDANTLSAGKYGGTFATPLVHNNESYNGANNSLYFDKPITEGVVSSTTLNDAGGDFFDNGNNFNPTGGVLGHGRFTAPITGYYNVMVEEECSVRSYGTVGGGQFNYTTYIRKYDTSGTVINSPIGYVASESMIGSLTGTSGGTSIAINGKAQATHRVLLLAGESLEVWRLIHNTDLSGTTGLQGLVYWYWKTLYVRVDVTLDKEISEGSTVTFADVVDDQVKVLDIINDVGRMFNIMWDADPVLKEVTAEPRDDFYGAIEDAVDFTGRLDLNKRVTTKYNSSVHKANLIFKYNADSSDKYVTERNKEQGTVLADYTHVLPSKFKEGTSTIKTSVLSATYWLADTLAIDPAQANLAPYTARYWSEFTEIPPNGFLEEHAPRLLNYSYQVQDSTGVPKRFRFKNEQTDRTTIPSVLPHQISIAGVVQASTPFNLFWHDVTGQNGLFVDYWSKTMTEIINGTGMQCYMLFNDKQWRDFKFNQVVYLSEPVEMKGYWLVEKIDNYQPENSSIVKVRLLNRVEWDVQTAGTVVYEAAPLGGASRMVGGGEITQSKGSAPNETTVLATVVDGNLNEMEVPMTIADELGNEVTLII